MKVAVISSGRPGAVIPMQELGWDDEWCTWYVGDGEYDTYRAAGASSVIEAGGLVAARNRALEDAFVRNEPSIQVSDDCVSIKRYDGAIGTPATPSALVADALDHVTDNCRLVGVAPTANAFYASLKVKRQHFIVGDFFVAAPSHLRFDPRLKLKEDYDFTASHLRAFGEVARLDWWLVEFRHRSNPGGAVAYRTVDLEDESIALLRKKWGSWIRDNPRRPHEILLRPR